MRCVYFFTFRNWICEKPYCSLFCIKRSFDFLNWMLLFPYISQAQTCSLVLCYFMKFSGTSMKHHPNSYTKPGAICLTFFVILHYSMLAVQYPSTSSHVYSALQNLLCIGGQSTFLKR